MGGAHINSLEQCPRLTHRSQGLPRLQLFCPTMLAYNAVAGSSVCSRGRLGRDWFQHHHGGHQLRDDYFWPDTSSDIHLKYILLAHIIFRQRAVYLCLGLQYWWCRTVVHYIKTAWLTCPSAPVYNTAAGSSVWAAYNAEIIFFIHFSRPGLHQHTRPHLSAWAVYWNMSKSQLG